MNTRDLMKKDLSHVNIPQIKQYVEENQNTDAVAADKAVKEFLDNYTTWKEIVGYWVGEDGEQLYGAALGAFSANLYFSSLLSKDTIELLQSETTEYEKKVKYMYGYKNTLYSNIVLCLHKLSLASNDELKGLLKKAIYYSLAMSNHMSYQVECYAFRKVSDYLIKGFSEESLSMSSPTKFNDPFDCPVLELLNLYGDDISKLVREAYQECLKITCFVKNTKVEPKLDQDGYRIWERKHEDDPDEYLNELMWAHYAKDHTGVCVKYHFNNNITKFADESHGQIAYFRDVRYTSDIYDYGKKASINLSDAFFMKSKAWEYENELRLLAFDLNGSGDYASIDAKNSIAAVYFGLKIDEKKRDEIISILKGRKWINEKRVWNESRKAIDDIKEEHPVEFYQMEIDEKHFGKLNAVKIG